MFLYVQDYPGQSGYLVFTVFFHIHGPDCLGRIRSSGLFSEFQTDTLDQQLFGQYAFGYFLFYKDIASLRTGVVDSAGQGVNVELLDTIQMIATIMNGMQEDFAYDR